MVQTSSAYQYLRTSRTPTAKIIARSIPVVRLDTSIAGSLGEGMSPLQLDRLHKHPEVAVDNTRQLESKGQEDEGFKEMIQLLRRTPPPGNFMSIPDNFSTSEDEKRNRFKFLRTARKPKKHHPPIIKLPDSAVAARTIEGHRYIAISIPAEHSYLKPTGSQYPTYNSIDKDTNLYSRSMPKRNVTTNQPVAVLNSVAEDKESFYSLSPRTSTVDQTLTTHPSESQSISLAKSQEQRNLEKGDSDHSTESISDHHSRTGNGNTPQVLDSTELKGGTSFKTKRPGPGATGGKVIPRTVDTQQSEEIEKSGRPKEPPHSRTEAGNDNAGLKGNSSKESEASTPMIISSTNPSIKLILPTRSSSKRAKTSIGKEETTDAPPPTINTRRLSIGGVANLDEVNDNFLPRGSVAESILTTESSPRLLKAQTAKAYHTIPIIVSSPPRHDVCSPLDLDFPKVPERRISRSVQTDLPLTSLQPPDETTQSGKNCTHERKSEDNDKSKYQSEGNQTESISEPMDQTTTGDSHEKSDIEINPHVAYSQPRWSSQGASLPPINVMLGIQPTMRTMSPTTILGRQKGKKKNTEFVDAGRLPPPRSTSFLPPNCIPARSSSYRRIGRQAKGKEKQLPKSSETAKTLAEQKETTAKLSHQELLHRYENLKEKYIYDMEKRQRRLERNVDYLMRCLGPFLDNISRRLGEEHGAHQETHDTYPPGPSSSQPRPSSQRQQDQPAEKSTHPRSVHDLINLFDGHRSQSFHGREPRRSRHRPTSLQLRDPRRTQQLHHQEETQHAVSVAEIVDARENNPLREEFEREIALPWFNGRLSAELGEPAAHGVADSGSSSTHFSSDDDNANEEEEISDAGPARPGTISPMIRTLQGTASSRAQTGEGSERGYGGEEEGEERDEFASICEAFARF